MADSFRRCSFFNTRNTNNTGLRYCDKHNQNYNYFTNLRNYKYLWAVILLLLPIKTLANTTVSSPQSQSTGVVNNNATMITPSSLPQNRYSQGIVCTSPSLTITPYLTDAWSFNRPIEKVTRQAIYDEDTGEIKYYQETPRFEKDNYNLNYGISMQFNIPLGNGGELCKKAATVNIEAQELLIKKTKMEISLYRLEMCSKMAKNGVQFVPNSPSAVTCEDIMITVPPNQVVPHKHELK